MTCVGYLPSLEDFVRDNLGADRLVNLNNQSKGGDNNAKGNRHETFFAAYKLAESYIESPEDDIEISSQEKAFVDDLTIMNFTKNSKQSYQLKDSKKVYWFKAKGIAPYFRDQYKVDLNHFNVDSSKTTLVLAQENVYKLRNKDIPESIKHHTECVLFKNSETANKMLLNNQNFKDVVSKFCAYPTETDKLEIVLQNLVGTWTTHNKEKKKVSEFIDLAKKAANPDFFKDSNSNYSISDKLSQILDNIDGLSYTIHNGFLNYEINDFSGIVRSKIGTPEFEKLSETIIERNPSDIMSLLGFLMGSGA